MNNSVFNCLLRVKQQLTNSIGKQNDTISGLMKGIIPDIEDDIQECYNSEFGNINEAITLENDEAISIYKPANSYEIRYTITRKDDDQYISSSGVADLTSVDINAILQEGYETTLKDVIVSLSHGETTNEALVKINELFLLNPNVSSSDCMSVLSSVKGLSSSDIEQIKDYITSLSVEGKISNFSWMSLFQSLCQAGDSTVSNDTLVVSQENFFALQSFMNTILTVTTVIFDAILLALGAIFKAIGWLIGIALSALQKIFTATFDTDYSFNKNASYPGVEGTLYTGLATPDITDINNFGLNQILRIQNGPEDIFLFKTKAEDGSIKIYEQSQICLVFHPYRLRNYILNVLGWRLISRSEGVPPHLVYDVDSNGSTPFTPWTYTPTGTNDYNDPYLRTEEYVNLGLDKDFLDRTVKANMLALWLCRTMAVVNPLSAVFTVAQEDQRGIDYKLTWCWLFTKYLDTADFSSALGYIRVNDIKALVEGLINDSINATSKSVQVVDDALHHLFVGYYPSPLHAVQGMVKFSQNVVNYYGPEDGSEPDVIPTENMVSLPSIDMSAIVTALTIVSAITIGTVIVGKRLNSKLRAKKQTRQAKRVKALNDYRNAYIANPESASAKLAYENALRKYNFKASIFGWGSYDSANGWVNASTIESTTRDIFDNLSTNDKVDEVRKLIKS